MSYDSEKYFELSRPYVSDETRRARRVLVFISTIIICAGSLDISITDVRIAGIILTDASTLKVTLVAIVVIVFWNIVLWLNLRRDKHYFAERKVLFDDELKRIRGFYETTEAKIAGGSKSTYSGHNDNRDYLAAHSAHLDRMKTLSKYDYKINKLDLWLPHSLSTGAVIVLLFGLKCAL